MSLDPNPREEQVYGHDVPGGGGGGGGGEKIGGDAPLDEDCQIGMNSNLNQLTLLFQGDVYVFESVTPEKVQAVLLLLGGCDVPTGIANAAFDTGFDDILSRTNMPARRIASLMRFREKRKERNFDKKIRYTVRKEVALSVGKDNLLGGQIFKKGHQLQQVVIPLSKMKLLKITNVKTVELVRS